MGKKILVAGAGHGGLTAAAQLAKAGFQVTVVERHGKENLGYDWFDALNPAVFAMVGCPHPEAAGIPWQNRADVTYFGPTTDEAHKIPEIGWVLKRLYDKVKGVQAIASGSSSEALAEKTEEPLTGRKFEYTLLPPSFRELSNASSPADEMRLLEHRLVYGAYPDVVAHPGDEVARIREIGKGYLYKDVLSHEEIKKPELLDRLLRALAFQIGQEVSYSEIAETAGCDSKTVAKYVDILEKAFIVFRLGSYSGNLRRELKKSKKVYFCDCGIRNYVLGDWRPLVQRGPVETGHIWENWFVAERRKRVLVDSSETRMFFWRTAQGQEVDLLEESAGSLKAYELKWNPKKTGRLIAKTFRDAYPEAECSVVSSRDCPSFLL